MFGKLSLLITRSIPKWSTLASYPFLRLPKEYVTDGKDWCWRRRASANVTPLFVFKRPCGGAPKKATTGEIASFRPLFKDLITKIRKTELQSSFL